MIDAIAKTIALTTRDTCDAGIEENDDRMGARISTIFVILATSAIGTFLPILSSKYSFIRLPTWVFFITKYFGSGVIFATGFIHLLQPSNDDLSTDCLGGVWVTYPMAFAFMMISFFVLFLFELVSFHYLDRKLSEYSDEVEGEEGHTHSHFGNADLYTKKKEDESEEDEDHASQCQDKSETEKSKQIYPSHFSHADVHQDPEVLGTPVSRKDREQYIGQLFGVMVLEFGVVFHSVFVGISLAIAGDEFVSLYIVLVFHQMFEGLGLGTRIATTNWPKKYKYTPWIMGLIYTLTTPIAIAIGLGVRTSYPPGSSTALIVNGTFDSISAGILIYTAIVELVAHEFLYSNEFKGKGGLKKMFGAYLIMCVGTALMALLGKWA